MREVINLQYRAHSFYLIVCVLLIAADCLLADEAEERDEGQDTADGVSNDEENSAPNTSHDTARQLDSAVDSTEPENVAIDLEKSHASVTWEEAPIETTPEKLADDNESKSLKGPTYVLEKVTIRGNKKILRQLILRYLDLAVGEVFYADDPRLEAFRYRLLASGRFYDVQLTLEKGAKRGWVKLLVTVTERNTIVIQDITLGFSDISDLYGSLDVAERAFLGTGVELSGAVVFSLDEQYGYRLRLQDDHFLNSPLSLHVEGLFAKARDFFGRKNVCVEAVNEAEKNADNCVGSDTAGTLYQKSVRYAVLRYRRGGVRIGTGYTLLKDNYFWVDYRGEIIAADVPKAGYHQTLGEVRPIEFGHLLWGHSFLSSIVFGLSRDTRDSITLTSEGARTALDVELSTELVGSDYEFSKFTLSHDMYFKVGPGHSLKLGLFGGLIMGSSPFFNQFFVGDFSSFVPSRVLELNFTHLQPNLLDTTIREVRYEDIAASITLEYALPFYRGSGTVYGVNGFVAFGAFFLASKEHLKNDPPGYSGLRLLPIDITADIGVKIDTKIGMFVLSLANLLRFVPEQGVAER